MVEMCQGDATAFRQEVRRWLETNCPQEMRVPPRDEIDTCWGGRKWVFTCEAQRIWLDRMAEKGWTVPTWPREYGGGGLGRAEEIVLRQEMARLGARPPLESFGISMLGPALLKFGNEEQKRLHLPQIARGSIRWCQGYSEPNAGSDLAALQTSATDAGSHFVVNGQKVWTSYADKADWIFCLVRTDPHAPKRSGISFLLIDMQTPGITTRPIRLISGRSPFCETFFDNVEVPRENLVGELNQGWKVAKHLLAYERQMIGSGGTSKGPLAMKGLGGLASELLGRGEDGRISDHRLRLDIARSGVESLCFELTLERYRDEASLGIDLGARSAVLKFAGTEAKKRRHDLLMSCAGFGALVDGDAEAGEPGLYARDWLRSKANSIEGGTSEIMLNIIAKDILHLPGN